METSSYSPEWKLAYGIVVQEIREQIGLSRAALERKASLGKGYMSHLEKDGVPEEPKHSTHCRIAEALGMEPNDLYRRFQQKQSELRGGQESSTLSSPEATNIRCDWGEAPDVSVFYGRDQELSTLEQWIRGDRSRVVVILGMGGVGKTALATKLADNLAKNVDDFQIIIWRSLREAPPLSRILDDLIKVLSDQQELNLGNTVGEKIENSIGYLRSFRCLIVLDNVESILKTGDEIGQFQDDYEEYGNFLKRFSEASHHSCLIITSREKPASLAPLEGKILLAQVLKLLGLTTEAKEILKDKGIFGNELTLHKLSSLYSGNPLALKIIASSIKEVFSGDITDFLSQEIVIFNGIRNLLDQQFGRLSRVEKSLMFWLAINREPVSIEELRDDFFLPLPQNRLIEGLEHLIWRSLIERTKAGFTLQNVVLEYVTDKLVKQASLEIREGKLKRLGSHALFKATAKEYVRQAQIRLILQPLQVELLNIFESQSKVESQLYQILVAFRKNQTKDLGYASGNVLNLLCQLKTDLREYDFSSLTVRQAYFQNMTLQGVNFSNSHFINSVFTETFGDVLSIAFNSDGTLLVAGGTNNEICLWRVANRQKICTYKGHSDWVNSVAFSPNGKTIASGSFDRTIKFWDINSGQCLKTLEDQTDFILSIAFSPNGGTLASAGVGKTIKIWRTSTGQCLNTLEGHTLWVWSVAFSHNGQLLASGSQDRMVKLWDVKTGRCLNTLDEHTNDVQAVAFSPDDEILASGSYDRTAKLWDVQSGRCLRTLHGHTNYVLSLAFNSDGQSLATGSSDKTIKFWSVLSGQWLSTLQGHAHEVTAVAFSPNDQQIASGSLDRSIKFWDTKTGQCINTLEGYASGMGSVTFSPDGQLFASVGNTQSIKIWDVASGACIKTLNGHSHCIWSVHFSPNGQILSSCSSDQTIKIWNVESGQCLRTLQGHMNQVRATDFSSDGQTVVSGSIDQTIKFWDINTGQCIKTLKCDIDEIWSLVVSPNGQTIAAACQDLKVWDAYSGLCIKTIDESSIPIFSVAFSPDSQILASAGNDHMIRLYDVDSGKCIRTLRGHSAGVWSVVFSPDGQILASGSSDKTVKLWQVHTGQCLTTFEKSTAAIWELAFSPDGQILASFDQDETVIFWDVNTGKPLKTLADSPYKGMNITNVKGLTDATIDSLKRLGAFEGQTEDSNL
jgi:WD40 repeat protein/transcriptional regulator with XRE-family HTH domain